MNGEGKRFVREDHPSIDHIERSVLALPINHAVETRHDPDFGREYMIRYIDKASSAGSVE